MIRIAIVEDEIEQARHLQDEVEKFFTSNECQSIKISCFKDAESFLFALEDGFDLVFLDIELPGMSGLQAARKMREIDTSAILFFVTRMGQYAINGYEVNAYSYLLKPITSYALKMNLQRCLEQMKTNKEERIILNTRDGVRMYYSNEVEYIEVMGHRLCYHTVDGAWVITGNLSVEEVHLTAMDFARCSRSFLVNMNRIRSVIGNTIRLISNEELIVSRSKKKEFMNRYLEFLGR